MDDLRDELLRLELAVAERRVADLPGGSYGAVLHDAFHETGASGRWWSREAILGALDGAETARVEIERFEIEQVAHDVILATYETTGERPARRSSIWVLDHGRWRLRFHQGTLL
jgi:ribonuclease HI